MADEKITQLTEDTSVALTDLIATVEDPTGTPVTKKVSLYTLWKLLGSADMSLYRQALINGSFDIWQRNTTFTYNDDTFGPDRWNLLTETNGAWTCARDTDVPSGGVSAYSAKFSNATQNLQCALVQMIENVDALKLAGHTVSLSFYAKTNSTEIANLRATILSWTGTADAMTSDVVGTWAQDGTDPTWATNYTAEIAGSNKALTSSWQRFTIEGIVLDTSSLKNLAVVIWVDDGTITVGDDFYITGIQVNDGAYALPLQVKTFADELNACKRFYQKSYRYSSFAGSVVSAAADIVGFNSGTSHSNRSSHSGVFPVTMRTSPSLTIYDNAGTASKVSSLSTADGSTDNVTLTYSIATSSQYYTSVALTAACGYIYAWVADAEL